MKGLNDILSPRNSPDGSVTPLATIYHLTLAFTGGDYYRLPILEVEDSR